MLLRRLSYALVVPLVICGVGLSAPAPKAGPGPDPDAPRARLGSDRFRPAGQAYVLAYSPDGTRLVAFAEYGMSVWDAATGRETRFVPWSYADPRLVTWPAKGQPLAVINPDNGGTYLWPFADEKAKLETLADDAPENRRAVFSHVALSADGSRVAAADAKAKGPIRICPANVGKWIGELEPLRKVEVEGGWADFGLTPDGKTLFVFGVEPKGGEVRMTLFDADTGKERKRLNVPSPAVDRDGRPRFAVSADGSLLVIGRANGTLGLVDLTGADAPQVWGKPTGFDMSDRVIAVSPDGKWIAADHFGRVVIVNGSTGRRIENLKQASHSVTALAFSPDGKRLACAWSPGLVEQWETATWEPVVRPEGHAASVSGVAISPDGKTAVTGASDDTLRVWDLVTGAEARSVKYTDSPQSVHFAPDGTSVLVHASDFDRPRKHSATKFARVDLTGRSEAVAGELGKGFDEEWPISRVVGFAADGKTLLTRRHRTITFWDWPAGTRQRAIDVSLPGNWAGELECRSACLSPDGRRLAVSLDHNEKKDFGQVQGPGGTTVVDAASGETLWTLATPKIWYAKVAFTPDGQKLVVAGRGDFKGEDGVEERISMGMYDAATGKLLRRFQLPEGVGEDREARALTVSLDGRLAAVGEADHSITVYELATGRIRQRLVGHRTMLKELVPVPNGRLVSTAWNDTFALVWATGPAAAAAPAPLADDVREAEWNKLSEPDARAAFRAMVRLAGDPTATVKFVQKHLGPAKAAGPAGDEELTADQLRAVRAVELLESVGGPDARKLIEELAKGAPGATRTTEAAAALRRMQSKRD